MSLKELQSLITAPTLSADAIMRCTLGVRTTELQAYCALVTGGPAPTIEIAERIGKSRPTAQRLLQGLVEKGLAIRYERLIGLGGYQYIYSAVDPEKMKAAVRENLERWYEKMMQEIDKLPDKIGELGKSCLDRYGQQRVM
jgi:predicted transcriptional regulator